MNFRSFGNDEVSMMAECGQPGTVARILYIMIPKKFFERGFFP